MNGLKTCELCRTEFTDNSRYGNMRFCSQKCQKKAWALQNKEHLQQKRHEYHIQHKDQIVARASEWRKNNPDKARKHRRKYKEKYATKELTLSNIERIKHNLRTRVTDVLNGRLKGGSAIQDLGCTPHELMKHLEGKFYDNPQSGEMMSWDNYGRNGWHIDHIEPLAKFDLTDPEQFKAACHYSNLQPLWWFDNLAKRDKLSERGDDV